MSMTSKLILKPVIEACTGGWQAKAGLYDGNVAIAVERFNAYDDKQEAWDNAIQGAKEFAKKHNDTCTCKAKMIIGSY